MQITHAFQNVEAYFQFFLQWLVQIALVKDHTHN
jgi:hypothetical protein